MSTVIKNRSVAGDLVIRHCASRDLSFVTDNEYRGITSRTVTEAIVLHSEAVEDYFCVDTLIKKTPILSVFLKNAVTTKTHYAILDGIKIELNCYFPEEDRSIDSEPPAGNW